MTLPSVTIGWFPRERFGVSGESLETLVANSPSCPLIIIDPASPNRYMDQVRCSLGDRPAEVVRVARPLLPAESKNLVLERVRTEFVALVENDVLFPPGWLEGLVGACVEEDADVATPVILEGRGDKEHFDKHLGAVRGGSSPGERRTIDRLDAPRNSTTGRRVVDFVEQHCLVFRTSVFDRIGRFDERLNTRDEVDVSMALHDAGCRVVLEPAVRIHYVPPKGQPAEDELPFYFNRWDLERAEASRDLIRDRWNLVETPGDLGFVRYRNLLARSSEVRHVLDTLASERRRVAVLDNGNWCGSEIVDGVEGLRPFPELRGSYGGFPPSGRAAAEEVDRCVEEGVGSIVVGYPAMWWLDELPELRSRLASLEKTRDDELMTVYEL